MLQILTMTATAFSMFGSQKGFGGFLLRTFIINQSEEIFFAESVRHDLRLAFRCPVIFGKHARSSILVIAHESAIPG